MQTKHNLPASLLPVLVIGVSGQVGSALRERLGSDGLYLDVGEVDLSKPERVAAALASHTFSSIINAAAYTAVDKAETEQALCMAINGTSVGILGQVAKERGVPIVHYSTDYVYPGDGDTVRDETAPTNPLNYYGLSKLQGENQLIKSGANHLIFRTSWVYDETGKNFLNTMLKLGAERETLSVVADQIGSPTYAGDIADATLVALAKAASMNVFPSGVYHLVNSGTVSWYGFAEAIFATAKKQGQALALKELKGITTDEYPTPAKRPANSRLNTSKLQHTFGVTLPSWQDALARCMDKKHNKKEAA